jgi:hypothetical protein
MQQHAKYRQPGISYRLDVKDRQSYAQFRGTAEIVPVVEDMFFPSTYNDRMLSIIII